MAHKLNIDRNLLRLAEAQHGVVARRQLLALGLSADVIVGRTRSGRLVRLDRGVYALGHRALRPEGRWMAAVLACGEGAVLSHRSAAQVWGLRPWVGEPEVTVPASGGAPRRAGVIVHRSHDLPPSSIACERGLPVTTVARTIVDLAGVVRPHELRRAVEQAERQERFDLRAVQHEMAARPRLRGATALRALLADAAAHDLPFTRSDVEAAMLQLCLDHRLPRPKVNRYDGVNEVDFTWLDHALVVEVDGWTTHNTRRAFANDRARDRAHLRAGRRVARFAATEVLRDPAAVAAELRALLAALSPSGGSAGAAASGGSPPGPAPR